MKETRKQWITTAMLIGAALAVGNLSACTSVMGILHGVKRPDTSEFGLGPRHSAAGRYTAVLEPAEALRTRRLQTIEITISDANGNPVEGAQITIDGGMPEHGHGLPTKPRVTKSLRGGVYVIEGVRFNMGGWWELEIAIAGSAGNDKVKFNLAL